MDELNSYLEFDKLKCSESIKKKSNIILGGFLPLGLTVDRGIWNSGRKEVRERHKTV